MIREQEIYILECSEKYKLNISFIALVKRLLTSIFVGFSDQKIFFKENFYKYFIQKTQNDIPINHFFPGNIQDNMSIFDEN